MARASRNNGRNAVVEAGLARASRNNGRNAVVGAGMARASRNNGRIAVVEAGLARATSNFAKNLTQYKQGGSLLEKYQYGLGLEADLHGGQLQRPKKA
ncbi:hypothetical protein, partial [Paenibacillus sp. S150]|uniref:hypothetical protein n=1 Tax=Paenibacillus sp. S150 TaxID=2749826 RepID=UPI001C58EA08